MKTYENFIINNPDIKYYDNGQKKSEKWYLNNKRHRENGPAYQQWYENGQNRVDGPSYQSWYKNGQKWTEEWVLNGKLHRVDGPAIQSWYKNGQKWTEKWYLNNKRHRENGPAYQQWYENGQKEYEGWWLNDKIYTLEKWVDKLKEIGSPYYEEQKMLLDIEKYNI